MKRVNNLFEQICSLENLQLADEKARKRKTHKYGIKLHERNREANILALREALLKGTFRTSEYSTFTIYEPKERLIYRLPYYPDRILHHAIMNVLEPIWLSVFTADTYSCIKNRGIHAGAQAVKEVLRKDPEGTKYCLKLDIRKFYPSIDHEIMKQIVRRKIKDARLLDLLDGIIDSSETSAEDKAGLQLSEGRPVGIPIGNYLSQYFANLYLTYFDHWLKEEKRVKYYFRYADDMVIFSSDKAELHALRTEIAAYLADRLRLEVKSNWQVFPTDSRGVDFLGFVFYHRYTLLRKKVKQNFCRAVARINRRKIKLDAKAYKQAICSWWGWVKYSDSRHFYKQLSKKFQYEIKF